MLALLSLHSAVSTEVKTELYIFRYAHYGYEWDVLKDNEGEEVTWNTVIRKQEEQHRNRASLV